MNRIFYYILLMILFSGISIAESSSNFIVLTTSESNNAIDEAVDKYKQLIMQDQTLVKLKNKEGFHTDILKENGTYILKVGPFNNSDTLTLTYLKSRMVFPQAFILENTVPQKVFVPKTKYVEKKVYIEKEDPTLWIALFGLGIIGIFALFLSSDQIKHIKKRHAKMQEKQQETEKRQNFILARMGEKIQDAVIENLKSETKILETPLKSKELVEIKDEIENIKKYDDDLLNTTYEMIDFLKIKSGNIVIHQEPFQLSTLLHKLTNAISTLLKKNNNIFYYDVKTNVTRYLVGDSLRIFQVLHNVLTNSLEDEENTNGKVVLSIEIKEKEKELLFKIVNENQYLDQEKIDSLFIPSTWEDLQKTNKDLGFFVTNELVSQMDGKFVIGSSQKNGTIYTLRLPYVKDPQQRSNKEQLREILEGKNVHIIDDDTLNMETLKYILESFDVKVERELTSHFRQHKPRNVHWDIVVLNSKDITPMHLEFFQKMRQEKGLKVILMHEIFESEDLADIALQITDAEIYSPIIPGDVEEVLFQLFMAPKEPETAVEEINIITPYEHNLKTIKITEAPEVSREGFQKFAGKNILIAEDNFVNQKVMSSILSASNIHVYKAENGLQALEILQHHDIDLILMDMSMPVMDGFAATRRIKEDPELKDIPIIAVTGLGFNHEIERMGQAGVEACIVKPFKIGQLYTAMDRYLVQEEIVPKSQEGQADRYIPNEEILDVQKGIINVHNKIFYREILDEVKELLENSNEHFLLMISERKLRELQVFSRDTLSLVETVGAVRLTKIFKEILVFLANKEGVSLEEYIPIYKKEWSKLKKEIELYLKH